MSSTVLQFQYVLYIVYPFFFLFSDSYYGMNLTPWILRMNRVPNNDMKLPRHYHATIYIVSTFWRYQLYTYQTLVSP